MSIELLNGAASYGAAGVGVAPGIDGKPNDRSPAAAPVPDRRVSTREVRAAARAVRKLASVCKDAARSCAVVASFVAPCEKDINVVVSRNKIGVTMVCGRALPCTLLVTVSTR